METDYLEGVKKQFEYYKMLGDKTFSQLQDEKLFWQYNDQSNSIATIVKHLCGNMLSRWTDFLTKDGEKEWRNRDAEFENDLSTRQEVIEKWEEGWSCLFYALNSLTAADLQKEIFIRNQGHSVVEAINRQLAHYPYHVGQIVFIGKMASENHWVSLSIPKGNSNAYNADKFSKPKQKTHFTDEYINQSKNSMNKQEIKDLLINNHNAFIDYLKDLSAAAFTFSHQQKWSAGQQLEHIILCIKPVERVFSMPTLDLENTFGKINRPVFSYDELLAKYFEEQKQGGKAPEKYVPATTPDIDQKEVLFETLLKIVSRLCEKIDNYSDEDLDTLCVPHPLLGNLTLREMLYNVIYHVTHHQNQTVLNLKNQQ